MIPPIIRNDLRKRYFQSHKDLRAIHGKEPTVIEVAIYFMLTEQGNPKDIKDIIDLIKEEEEK